MSALWQVQRAIYTKLTADEALMSVVSGVFDEPPEDRRLPYVTIGEVTETPWDTHDKRGFEAMVTINAWSGYQGNREAAEILAHVDRILHRRPLPVAGWTVISITHTADGVRKVQSNFMPNVRQGQARYRVRVEQE